MNGYTAKVAGTEMGVNEPEATFSPCFGGPFLVWHPSKYAELLAGQLQRHGDLAALHPYCHELLHRLLERDTVLAKHRDRRTASLAAIERLRTKLAPETS